VSISRRERRSRFLDGERGRPYNPRVHLDRVWLLLLACGCSSATSDPPAAPPTVGEAVAVVPGPGMPPEYTRVAGPSNNNLDVARHDGRVFLATRNAPDHFASPDARLFLFSSDDERTWRFESEIRMGTDLREPRLLSYRGRLFLYFAQLGTDQAKFEPRGMFVSEYRGPGQWSAPAGFYRPGEKYIPWRAKVYGGRAWLSAYRDGQHIYDFSGKPIDVELLVSDDGLAWSPASAARPVISTGGGSETDFAFDSAGDLYAVIRNERGDPEFGWGSKICRAPRGDVARWTCRADPKKYDSPAVFAHRDRIFLVGRRHVSDDGNYQQRDEPWSLQATINNLVDYSRRPKRCALWQVDRVTLTVRHVVDVPGWGDTCFPSLLADPSSPDRFALYNYSSPLDAPEPASWMAGQKGETRVYRAPLEFTR
jgi:hypothetical protein